MSSSFYITLPSNSSMDFYPSNTLTNYVTKLPQAVDLTGEWEVGLFELQFPVSYYNVTDEETKLLMYTNFDGKMIRTDVSPPSGYYENPGLLVREINEVIALVEQRKNLARFRYNDISKKISVRFLETNGADFVNFLMTEAMAELLGFEWQTLDEHLEEAARQNVLPFQTDSGGGDKPNIVARLKQAVDGRLALLSSESFYQTASRVCDLRRGFYSLFVYCDIAEHSVVGESRVPLLRVVNAEGKEGSMVNRIFQTVQYVPVQRKQFDTIEIDIRDDAGRPVPFQRGRVIATLHFRAKKPAYF